MTIRQTDIPTFLIARIEAAHPAPAYFDVIETDDWPADVLAALLRQRVLTEVARTESIACLGCERQCHKRVVVRQAGAESRAFIVCDEDPGHGRIPVSLRDLRRFETGLRAFSTIIATELKIGPPKISRGGSTYALGVLGGRNGMRPVLVVIENDHLVLGVGEQREPLGRTLNWSAAGLTVDAKVVQLLADRKVSKKHSTRAYTPDRSAQQALARKTRRRDVALYTEAKKRFANGGTTWTQIADDLGGTNFAPGLKGPSVRRILSKMRAAERKKPRSKPKETK